MTPRQSLSPRTHLEIVKLRQQNISIRKIANKLDVAKSIVSDIWKLFQQTGDIKEQN